MFDQTRQKLKEAFDVHTAALIERAEKQIILAQHARRLVSLLDDTPIVPGDTVRPYEQGIAARDILNDAETDLRAWEASIFPISSSAKDMGQNLIPKSPPSAAAPSSQPEATTVGSGAEATEPQVRATADADAEPVTESHPIATEANEVNESATIATA